MLTKASKRAEGEGEPGAPKDMYKWRGIRWRMAEDRKIRTKAQFCGARKRVPGARCQQESHKPGARCQQGGQVKVEGCCGLNPLPTDMHRCEQLTKIHTSGKQANNPVMQIWQAP